MLRRPSLTKSRKVELLILAIAFLGLLGFSLASFFIPKGQALTANVILKGELIHRLSLQEEKELSVTTDIGEVEIHVHNGGVAVTSSPCASQFCVHSGFKYRAGEAIVCAPAGLSVYLEGGTVSEVTL